MLWSCSRCQQMTVRSRCVLYPVKPVLGAGGGSIDTCACPDNDRSFDDYEYRRNDREVAKDAK